jgi:hypothetical protein
VAKSHKASGITKKNTFWRALPRPRYERIVAAHDRHGEMVDDPQELLPALSARSKSSKKKNGKQCST